MPSRPRGGSSIALAAAECRKRFSGWKVAEQTADSIRSPGPSLSSAFNFHPSTFTFPFYASPHSRPARQRNRPAQKWFSLDHRLHLRSWLNSAVLALVFLRHYPAGAARCSSSAGDLIVIATLWLVVSPEVFRKIIILLFSAYLLLRVFRDKHGWRAWVRLTRPAPRSNRRRRGNPSTSHDAGCRGRAR